MRTIIATLVLLVVATCTGTRLMAQTDPHFSQYYVYPSWLNPALTGVFDGDYRVAAIYRTQWGNISPFKTYGVSGEIPTSRNINIGASVLNQTAGDGGYNYTTAYVSAAYTGVKLDASHYHQLNFGLQLGFIQRKFDPSKLTYGEQWNPVTGYNPGNPVSDALTRTSAASFDAGAGALYYDATPGKKFNIYGGFSVMHLTKPQDQFSAKGDARFPMRFNVHGGVKLTLSDILSITPNFLFMQQGPAQEKMIGAYGQLNAAAGTDFLLGLNYRYKDAITTHAGFIYKNMMLGASYDINTSDLSKMAHGSNSFEISLTFIGRRSVRTPDVEFVCPRL
ncbi:type IX secretion system PorP/SprF family membrane protein [Chitinophaga polysaccharea]|uniref:Type IX secretion system PorP/SprF family membrane protein n=1 Tax=Chitinophaga polysaccharea TaxID=1293035 RepID=A0A561P3I8_9BACT|nr:PorP/SprF family type IX secretion system membrane protein [Chitinophaga polysaccharea]TWF32680.1 type IX secretion system PorP/SprF family membrane protein [Chitinophaga polysaccharea]